jgi:hypothetical protein
MWLAAVARLFLNNTPIWELMSIFYFFSIFFSSSLDLLKWSGFFPTVPMTYFVVAKKTDIFPFP